MHYARLERRTQRRAGSSEKGGWGMDHSTHKRAQRAIMTTTRTRERRALHCTNGTLPRAAVMNAPAVFFSTRALISGVHGRVRCAVIAQYLETRKHRAIGRTAARGAGGLCARA